MTDWRKKHCCDQDSGCDAHDCDDEDNDTCECLCSRCYGSCDYCEVGEPHDSCGGRKPTKEASK